MYTIQKTDFGLHITMGGRYCPEEIARYVEEKERMMAQFDRPFSILVDLRAAYPPDHEDEQRLEQSQTRMQATRLERMAIVTLSPVVRNQAQQIAINARLKDKIRFINASKHDNWEELAMMWIKDGVEPVPDQTNPRMARA